MIIKGLLCVPSDVLRTRRPFVAFGLILSAIMFFSASSFSPSAQYGLYIVCLMLRNTGAAISDGASDGLTIDADVDALSGTLSAWQGVGRMSGLILSTLVGGAIASQSFAGLLIFLGAWMLLSSPVALIVKEELTPSPLAARIGAAWCRALNAVSCGWYDRVWGASPSDPLRTKPDPLGVVAVANPLRASRAQGAASWGGTSPYNDSSGSASPDVMGALLQHAEPPPLALVSAVPVAPLEDVNLARPSERARDGEEGLAALPGTADEAPAAALLEEALSAVPVVEQGAAPVVEQGAAPVAERGAALVVERGAVPVVEEGSLPAVELGAAPFELGAAAAADAAAQPPLTITVPPLSSSDAPPSPGSTSSSAVQLTVAEAFFVLLRHVRRVPVAAFVIFMFAAQFATYIASFPVVLWLQEQKDFSLAEVGYLTIIGAFGNMLGCYVSGVTFDTVPSKRLALATATLLSTFPYLLFLVTPNKASVYTVWVLCSVGYGALYTVQTSMMRLLADASVAAAYSGLCMGMLAVAAAVGTFVGGVIAEGDASGYEACYRAGAYTSIAALVTVPWITASDPDVESFKAKERAERAKAAGGKVRRRASFVAWVGALRGTAARDALVASDSATERALAAAAAANAAVAPRGNAAAASRSSDADATSNDADSAAAAPDSEAWHLLPKLRRPALGSMANLLDARDTDAPTSLLARVRSNMRGLFSDQRRNMRRRNSDWSLMSSDDSARGQ